MKYSNFIKGKSIRFKLLFYFLSLILFLVISLVMFSNMAYSQFIKKQTINHTVQMINQVKKNVEFHIIDMENIIRYITIEPNVIDFLRGIHVNDNSYETEIRNILKSYTQIHSEVAGILIVNDEGRYISNEMQSISRDPLTSESWYIQSSISPYSIQLFSKPMGRNLETQFNYSADDVVSIVKAVLDPDTRKCIGVVLIDLKQDTLKKIMDDATFDNEGFLFIIDSNGDIVCAPVNSIVYRIDNKWFNNSISDSIIKNIKGSDYQIIYNDSSYTKWKTIGVFSITEILKVVLDTRNYIYLIGIITIVLAVIVALFFTSSIDKPLRKLRSLMKRAEVGDLNVHFNSKYNDEIGQLGESFNHMIEKIKNLIELVYKEQKSQREAELKTLQAQIKPHFLYNTLDTINCIAREHGTDDIVEIVSALANFFRIGLSKGKEIIKVSEELDHVRSYLVIQKVRYEDKLNYEINYEEGVLDYYVVKLILQPIVENAIYHGIKLRRENGKLIINVKKVAGKLLFIVHDNGIGIPSEKAEEIMDILEGRKTGSNNIGYGIFNVNERIRLTYGSDYGIKLSSIYGEGTTVEIWQPLIERW